jgi:hypothetical protein
MKWGYFIMKMFETPGYGWVIIFVAGLVLAMLIGFFIAQSFDGSIVFGIFFMGGAVTLSLLLPYVLPNVGLTYKNVTKTESFEIVQVDKANIVGISTKTGKAQKLNRGYISYQKIDADKNEFAQQNKIYRKPVLEGPFATRLTKKTKFAKKRTVIYLHDDDYKKAKHSQESQYVYGK